MNAGATLMQSESVIDYLEQRIKILNNLPQPMVIFTAATVGGQRGEMESLTERVT